MWALIIVLMTGAGGAPITMDTSLRYNDQRACEQVRGNLTGAFAGKFTALMWCVPVQR